MPTTGAGTAVLGEPPRKARGRWRAACLASIYLLAGIHIAHWKIAGKTLAPLELNEVMHTLELGVITAGFIFMAVTVVATAVVGRFFCSWGCHILALQDGCAWLLARIGIRPKPVRSRLLLLVAPAALVYMFVWPQVVRIVEGRPAPTWRVVTDAAGWASFTTTDFWRNLPGPGVTIVTFLVCGGAIIYVLGSRSFCRYACPYGALFGLADRISPGRILSVGDCTSCGRCTAACKSNIRVHEELTVFGQVVSPSCLKDLDCVDACPQRAVRFGFARPGGLRSFSRRVRRPQYDFSWAEELLAATVFMTTLLATRGLYGTVPFLLALGIAGIAAYLGVVATRLLMADNVRLNRHQLKLRGVLTRAGTVFAVMAVVAGGLLTHCIFIRVNEHRGHTAYDRVVTAAMNGALEHARRDHVLAVESLQRCDAWGLARPPRLDHRLATLYLLEGDGARAASHLDRLGAHDPAASWELRGDVHACLGESDAALEAYAAALRCDARRPRVHHSMAQLLVRSDPHAAREHLEAAIALDADDVEAHARLAAILSERLGELDGAVAHAARACSLRPDDAFLQSTVGTLLLRRGDLAEAEVHLSLAVELDPRMALPRLGLGRLAQLRGHHAEAERHFAAAAHLARLAGQPHGH